MEQSSWGCQVSIGKLTPYVVAGACEGSLACSTCHVVIEVPSCKPTISRPQLTYSHKCRVTFTL